MVARAFVLVAVLGGCTADDTRVSWHDASEEWSQAWCSVTKRCDPAGYRQQFVDDSACEIAVTLENCAPRLHDCAAPYDRPLATLDECAAAMDAVVCGEPLPAVCLTAMQP
jgi:hypothetical protein